MIPRRQGDGGPHAPVGTEAVRARPAAAVAAIRRSMRRTRTAWPPEPMTSVRYTAPARPGKSAHVRAQTYERSGRFTVATLRGTKSVALGRFRWAHARDHMSTRTGVPAARNQSIRGVPPLPRWGSAGEARGPIVGWCQSTKLRCVATWSRLISVNPQDRCSATALTQGVSLRTARFRGPRRRARATRSSTTRRPSPWRRCPRSTAKRRMRACPWSPGTSVPVARMRPPAST